MKCGVGCEWQISAQAEAAEEGEERRRNRRRVAGMMEKTQRQNGMGRSSLMPDKDGKQNDPAANERRLHRSNVPLTEIDKGPHQAAAARAGEKRTGIIEAADDLSDALVHSGDHEDASDNGDGHVDQESPAP